MGRKIVIAVPGGTALTPALAIVDDPNDPSNAVPAPAPATVIMAPAAEPAALPLPHFVGWGQIKVIDDKPTWLQQSGYFAKEIGNKGPGDWLLKQAVPDNDVRVFGPAAADGAWLCQHRLAANGEIPVYALTWRGAEVRSGTLTGFPCKGCPTGDVWIYVLKLR